MINLVVTDTELRMIQTLNISENPGEGGGEIKYSIIPIDYGYRSVGMVKQYLE
jgi:hypothetical protein